MTDEEKELLLKDLCARLPYGVILDNPDPYGENWDELISIDVSTETVMLLYNGRIYNIEDVKPYLRPLESMTKEEREEVQVFICDEWFFEDSGFATKVRKEGYVEFLSNYDCSGIDPEFCGEYIDWLNEHHFDYRIVPSTGKSMIESGLALEAKEGMYKV